MNKTIAAISAGVLTLGALVAAVILVGSWGESSATAKQNYCNSLDNLASTVTSYQGLNVATATNDELDAAADDIYGAWDDVVNDAEDWANAYDNPLTNAYNDLYYAIQDLPGDNTVAEDFQDLEPELSAFPQAFHETFDGSGCSST